LDLLKPSYATGYAKNASQSAHPNLWDGLVGAWMPSLGVTGETLRDVSGNGNHGTLTNMDAATDWVATSRGLALDYDGGNDYVTCGAKKKFEFFLGDSISTSCWVKPTNTSIQAFQAMFTIGGSAGVPRDRTYQLRILSDRRVNALYRNLSNNAWHEKRTNASHVNNNEWINIATTFTYGAGASWKIYINGKVVDSFYYAGNGNAPPINTSNDEVFIGVGEDGSSQHWLGNIGNFLLYRRYLSPSEINHLYVDSLAPFRTKKRTVVRVPAAIPAATVVGSIKKPATIIKPSYQAGYARNASESENPKLWDGLVGAWMPSLGVTGDKLRDVSGNGNHGTLTNMDAASDWVATSKGLALDFDGVNDYVNTNGSVVSLDDDFTFLVVVRTPSSLSSNSTFRGLISKGDLSSKWASISYNANGNRFVVGIDDGAIKSEFFGSIPLSPRKFYSVAGVFRRGKTLELYVNAELDGSTSDNSGSCDISENVFIGSRKFGSAQYFMRDLFLSASVYNRALSPTEIKQLYVDSLAPFRKKQRVSVAVPAAVPTPSATYHPLRSLAHPLEQ